VKKAWKILVVFLAVLLFSGCRQAKPPAPAARVVTRIDISCRHGNDTILRSYTQPEKLRHILYYMRLQDRRGYADTNPERVMGDVFLADIHLSDGSRQVYRQRADRYISLNSRRWRMIPTQQGKRFYYLLWAIPGDAEPK